MKEKTGILYFGFISLFLFIIGNLLKFLENQTDQIIFAGFLPGILLYFVFKKPFKIVYGLLLALILVHLIWFNSYGDLTDIAAYVVFILVILMFKEINQQKVEIHKSILILLFLVAPLAIIAFSLVKVSGYLLFDFIKPKHFYQSFLSIFTGFLIPTLIVGSFLIVWSKKPKLQLFHSLVYTFIIVIQLLFLFLFLMFGHNFYLTIVLVCLVVLMHRPDPHLSTLNGLVSLLLLIFYHTFSSHSFASIDTSFWGYSLLITIIFTYFSIYNLLKNKSFHKLLDNNRTAGRNIVSDLELIENLKKSYENEKINSNHYKEKYEHLISIIESMNSAIVSCNLQNTIVYWNRLSENLFGYNYNEAIGKPFGFMFIYNPFTSISNNLINILGEGHTIRNLETTCKHKDGSLVNVSMNISPIRDLSNQLIGTTISAYDITKEKKQQQRFLDSEDLNRKIVSNLPLAILLFQEDGECILANEASSLTLGIPLENLIMDNLHVSKIWVKSKIYDMATQSMETGIRNHGSTKLTNYLNHSINVDFYTTRFHVERKPYLLILIQETKS